jgi:hypothetical protein
MLLRIFTDSMSSSTLTLNTRKNIQKSSHNRDTDNSREAKKTTGTSATAEKLTTPGTATAGTQATG